MKTRIFIFLVLTVSPLVACSQEQINNANLQVCNDAMKDYEAARERTMDAQEQAKQRVLKACYSGTGSGRAPLLQEPILIGADRKAAAPLKAAPAPEVLVNPSQPSPLTSCDAGGCWDNLGNRYNGTGSTLFGPTGKPCVRSGAWVECR